MQFHPPAGDRLSVAVVGAGIVGCATALALAQDGHRVTVFDRQEPGAGTSSGNAGAIVTGAVTPSATPAVVRALPAYLLDRHSPAVLRLRHGFRALPWLMRFAMAGRAAEVDRIAAAMAPLVSVALKAHRELAALAGAADLLTQEGWLKVYRTKQEFEASALERRLMQNHGVVHEVIDCADILDLQPGLNPELCFRGVFQPQAGNVRSPTGLARAYLQAAVARGARMDRDNVTRVSAREGDGIVLRVNGQECPFDRLVIAAGAWSATFARQLGDRVSLDAERGYHLGFGPGSEDLLRRPVVMPGMNFVLSPMHEGLRLVSGDELAGLTAAPNYKRIEKLVPKAVQALPALADWQPRSRWMGHRPSTPDSLPVIGRSCRSPHAFYAFGHGHLGVTLAATTAQQVAALLADRRPTVELSPFSAARF